MSMKIRGFVIGVLGLGYLAAVQAQDVDNNPPGMMGGPGTNWENPPGWRGGPGASPGSASSLMWAGRTSKSSPCAWRMSARRGLALARTILRPGSARNGCLQLMLQRPGRGSGSPARRCRVPPSCRRRTHPSRRAGRAREGSRRSVRRAARRPAPAPSR